MTIGFEHIQIQQQQKHELQLHSVSGWLLAFCRIYFHNPFRILRNFPRKKRNGLNDDSKSNELNKFTLL